MSFRTPLGLIHCITNERRCPINFLLHPADRPFLADIYVLCVAVDTRGNADLADLLGWAWRNELRNAPVRVFSEQVSACAFPETEIAPRYCRIDATVTPSHCLPETALHPMSELDALLGRRPSD
jgi:hypothetical protein